jgi:hypothetical protein
VRGKCPPLPFLTLVGLRVVNGAPLLRLILVVLAWLRVLMGGGQMG